VLAKALAVEAQPGQDVVDAVSDWLGSRRALLVLDDAEDLIDASARLADRLLRRAQGSSQVSGKHQETQRTCAHRW